MLKDYLSSFAPQLHGHVELRAQISTSHAVAMLNGDLQSNARAQQGGVSARVYRNGVYGFASAVEYDEESVRRVLKAAEENALFLDARVKKNRPALPVLPGAVVGGLAILVVSIVFSTMISASARYTLVYGSLASLIILMLWLHLMGTIILIGGLVNLLYWQHHCDKEKR